MKGVALALLLIFLRFFAAAAQTGNWPDRPIRLVVPFPPGSSSDIVARIVAQGLSGKLGQPVVVEDRPGASTALGARICRPFCARTVTRSVSSIPRARQ